MELPASQPHVIASPLRILILSVGDTPIPEPFIDTTAATHEIRTPYYHASIPIWRDDIPATLDGVEAWRREWMADHGDDAGGQDDDGREGKVDVKQGTGEVISAVGAWVVVFRKPRLRRQNGGGGSGNSNIQEKGGGGGGKKETEDLDIIRASLTTTHDVVQHHLSSPPLLFSSIDPLFLAVGMRQSSSPSLEMETERWEDVCRECGSWEWIDGTVDAKPAGEAAPGNGKREDKGGGIVNEFGEKTGIARLFEALEANEWESAGGEIDDSGGLLFDEEDEEEEAALGVGFASSDLDGHGPGGIGFGKEAKEMQSEMWGLKDAIQRRGERGEDQVRGEAEEDEEDGDDDDVRELESMMLKLQAVRDLGADMPEAERRRVAARAVRDVMKKM